MRHFLTLFLLLPAVPLLPSSSVAGAKSVDSVAGLLRELSELLPGDTLLLADGEYRHDGIVIEGLNGTAASPIVIASRNIGGAHFSGGRITVKNASHLVISGLRITRGTAETRSRLIVFNAPVLLKVDNCKNVRISRFYFQPDESMYPRHDLDHVPYWVCFDNGNNNRIDHCLFDRKVTIGSKLKLSPREKNLRIDHNYFKFSTSEQHTRGETIQIGESDIEYRELGGESQDPGGDVTTDCIVEYNLFEECNGDAEIISVKRSRNIIRYNTFINCEAQVVIRHANEVDIYNNLVFGDGREGVGGVRFYGSQNRIYNNYFAGLTGAAIETGWGLADGGYLESLNNIVAFNTFANCSGTILKFGNKSRDGHVYPPRQLKFKNNVIVSTAQLIAGDSDVDTEWAGNIAAQPDGSEAIIGRSLRPEEIILADPLLVQVGQLWKLSASSPAIGLAVAIDEIDVEFDLEGQVRGKQKDIGADEYMPQRASIRILRPADVGPLAASEFED